MSIVLNTTETRLWQRVRGRHGLRERLRTDVVEPLRKGVVEPIADGLRAGGEATARRIRTGDRRSRLNAPILVGAGIAGAIGEYFLDPQSGRRRRAMAKDRVAGFLRRRKAGAERQARYAAGGAKGAMEEAMPSPRRPEELNDPALEAKVESEIFRSSDTPKDRVNVNVEEGVVYLRGELPSPEQIEELVSAAARIEGVRTVENLLHLPGEEAPAKANGHGRGDPKRAAARG